MRKLLLAVAAVLGINSAVWAGATFSRIKTWNTGEILTASDLNAEFNNILNNLTPAGVDDYSANNTEMRTVTDPYPGFSESLATSLQGEIERLRYQVLQLKKSIQVSSITYWYEDTPATGTFVVAGTRIGVNKTTPTHTLDVVGSMNVTSSGNFNTLFIAGNALTVATQDEMEAATSNIAFVAPNITKYAPGAAKAWVVFNGTGTPAVLMGHNVASITDNGTGDYTINFTVAFSGNYACNATGTFKAGNYVTVMGQDEATLPTASAIRFYARDSATETAVDPTRVFVTCYGDQ